MTLVKTPTLWRYTAREMQRRPGRTLLTLFGIVIGVAATVAVSVTVQTTRRAHRDMFEAVSGRAALEVVAEGLGGFEESVAARLESLPGIKAAVPAIQTPAALTGPGGMVPVLVLGIDPTRDAAARDYVLREGQTLDGEDGVLLEAGFAESQRFGLGKAVHLLTTTGFTELPVQGLLEPRGAATFNGGAVAVLQLATAQRLFALPGRVNSVQLVLEDGANLLQVEDMVRRQLPEGLTVQPPANRGALGREGMVATEQGLATLSASSLVAGAFVILNAFLMNLGERRRQLAILRALGATRSQVTRLLLREAVLLGSAGTVLGIALGAALSLALRHVMGQVLALTLPELRWTAEPFLLAVALGPGMALAATYVPARRAGRRSPLEDLLHRHGAADTPAARADEGRRWPALVGVALLATVALFVVGTVRGWLNPTVAVSLLPVGMALALVGCVLSVPLFLGPLMCLAGRLLAALMGRESGLAMRQLARHRSRTALTAGVLLLAVIFAVGFGQSLRNNVRHIHQWFASVIATDFYVRGAWPDLTSTVTTVPLPESLAAELAALDGVERVGNFNFVLTHAGGHPVVVLAYSFPADRPMGLALAEGDPSAVQREHADGGVILATALAHRLGVGVGDTIMLQTRRGPQALQVAGTASEYTGGGMALYMDWDTARRLFDLRGVHTFFVTARHGATPEAQARLKAFCDQRGLLLQSNAEVRAMFDGQIDGFLGLVWVLLALVFVVASLGVVNTLTMNVLEQTRELGVLRAIGMKRGQVARMVFVQALALSVISLVPGIPLGLSMAYAMNVVTYALIGQPVQFHVDAAHVGGCVVVALAVAGLAAFFPARRAARLQVVRALQYE